AVITQKQMARSLVSAGRLSAASLSRRITQNFRASRQGWRRSVARLLPSPPRRATEGQPSCDSLDDLVRMRHPWRRSGHDRRLRLGRIAWVFIPHAILAVWTSIEQGLSPFEPPIGKIDVAYLPSPPPSLDPRDTHRDGVYR